MMCPHPKTVDGHAEVFASERSASRPSGSVLAVVVFLLLPGGPFGMREAAAVTKDQHVEMPASRQAEAIARRIVADQALGLLPATLREFLERHRAEWGRQEERHVRSAYVLLDAGTADFSDAARRAAVAGFPHERAAAEKLLKSLSLPREGTLPWELLERYHALSDAFRSDASREAVRAAGEIIALSTAAAMPFNTTMLRFAEVRSTAAQTGLSGYVLFGEPAERTQNGPIVRHFERLGAEVRIWPKRCGPLDAPRDAVFDVLGRANGRVSELFHIDADAIQTLRLISEEDYRRHREAYDALTADRLCMHVEAALEDAALLAAGLLLTAWIQAGQPIMPDPEPVVAEGGSTSSPPLSEAPSVSNSSERNAAAAYVASRSSGVFHLGSCHHAAQIRPENRVEFPSEEAARKTGRTRCRSCLGGKP